MNRVMTPPPHHPLPSRIAAFVEHLERNRELPPQLRLVKPADALDPALAAEALERLAVEHEELAVAAEELRVQLESMAASERALEREATRYREVFDFAPDPLFVTDREGSVLEANQAALQVLSMEVRFLQGKPLVTRVERADWPARPA